MNHITKQKKIYRQQTKEAENQEPMDREEPERQCPTSIEKNGKEN